MQTLNQEKKYSFGQKAQANLQQQPVSQQSSQPRAATSGAGGPLKSFRSGAIQVAIWENENLSPEGQIQTYKTVSFERRYKDKSGEWKSSNSLRVNDLPKAALLLSKAYEYLVMTGEDSDDTAERIY
jgi:hypothetical protein